MISAIVGFKWTFEARMKPTVRGLCTTGITFLVLLHLLLFMCREPPALVLLVSDDYLIQCGKSSSILNLRSWILSRFSEFLCLEEFRM